MEKLEFECEVITPMFLGGADGQAAELRAPSIKGALRFWWRAMNGHLSIKDLHKKETEIFGGGGEIAKRSQVIVRVEGLGNLVKNKNQLTGNSATNPSFYTQNRNANTIKYLSFGTYDFNDANKNRESIKPPSKFKIILQTPNSLKEEMIKTLRIVSTYGSLGSKSRNGFGSFRIIKINSQTGNHYLEIQSNLFTENSPNYSAFSKNCKLFKTNSFTRIEDVLSVLGDSYRLARIETDGRKYEFKNRVLLAEPLNGERDFKIMDRRTKPFFMNVRFIQNQYIGYLLYLPQKYVHDRKLVVSSNRQELERLNSNFSNACQKFIQNLISKTQMKEVSI
jgi:CRISPR-associated protein Cmr1